MNSGSFNRLIYYKCAYEKNLSQSVEPLHYVMYSGKFENCSKCTYNDKSFWHPYDLEIIDTESELKGINRIVSKCPQHKYSPNCKKSEYCMSTYDDSSPVVLSQELCPIVHNNIPRVCGPGYELKKESYCKK